MIDSQEQKQSELHTVRDTVESIWVAIVLAFLLRAFLIEAFVIPTGSMAPRLYGEHWMLHCPSCKREYAFGVQARRGSELPTGALCPNCSFHYAFSREDAGKVRSGDRVLVLKYLYQFVEPEPWDVVVFKNPQDNHQNYIKRLIGLPGETIEIVHGDIYFRKDPSQPMQIRRKPHRVQEVMWQTVYDNDLLPDPDDFVEYYSRREELESPSRWYPFWRPATDASAETFDGLQKVPVGPNERQWRIARTAVYKGGPTPGELVLDATRSKFLPHYGYNGQGGASAPSIHEDVDLITDLKLSASYSPKEDSSRLTLHLSSFDHRFRAVVDAAGRVELQHQKRGPGPEDNGAWETWAGSEIDPLTGRIVNVALTHVDFTVRVWIDGQWILESTREQYDADYEQMKRRLGIGQSVDIAESTRRWWFETPPEVRIIASQAPCELTHLKLMRDVYYTNSSIDSRLDQDIAGTEFAPLLQYAHDLAVTERTQDLPEWARRLGDKSDVPNGWGVTDFPIQLDDHPGKNDLDEFYVLGDNSPQSHDSRSWVMAAPTLRLYDQQGRPQYKLGTVPRYNMLGRAMFVYWPSGFRIKGLNVPLIPNVGKMRFIK